MAEHQTPLRPRDQRPAAPTVTRRGLLAAGVLTAVGVVAACGTDGGNAGSGGEGGGDFDFSGATPAGQLIPTDARQSAPAFSGELLDGTSFESTSLAGDIVVLNFWGSWCSPCRVESPEFQAVYTDVADQGVAFLGVAVRDQRQLAQAFIDDFDITYPSLFDPSGEIALTFRGFPANVVPTTLVLDRDNRVAAVYVSAVSQADLRTCLTALLAETPATSSSGPAEGEPGG